MELPEGFPPAVAAEAEAVAARLAAETAGADRVDLTDVELCTIDPAGSSDLDQAMHLERAGDGYRLRYAIADLPAVVRPGGPIDDEARRRGQTLYAADGTIPLHPPVLANGAASLLPGQLRRAYVWTFDLDARAAVTGTRIERATVRSRRQWSYVEAQAALGTPDAAGTIELLAELGPKRLALEAARGGASLSAPEEEIVADVGGYQIERRVPVPLEEWNAQVSLLTGMAAAQLMLDAGIGLLRTMPPADADAIAGFRAQVAQLGRPWPSSVAYGDYLRGLDRTSPRTAAILQAASALFRGADYLAFDGAPPAQPLQAAIAAPYAHATAPLRRLGDRWSLALCEAIANERAVPGWARDSLPSIPAIMRESGARASRLEAASIDRVEAALLSARIGETFDAVVIAASRSGIRVQLDEPFVTTSVPGAAARPGEIVRVRVDGADIQAGLVELSLR